MEILELLESDTVEIIFLALDLVLAGVSLYLYRLLRGSLFERIPPLLLLSAVGLFAHALIEDSLVGYLETLLYAATALFTSACVLLLLLQVGSALRAMAAPAQSRVSGTRDVA